MTDLLSDIQAFCETHSLSETRFGALALNDTPFVAQLRSGRDLRMSTVRKVRHFMATFKGDPRTTAQAGE